MDREAVVAPQVRYKLAGALRMLEHAQAEGVLRVKTEAQEARFYFLRGRLVGASSSATGEIGIEMVSGGLLSAATLRAVLSMQRRKKIREPLAQMLVTLGLVPEETARVALDTQVISVFADCTGWTNGVIEFESRPVRVHDLNPTLSIDALQKRATDLTGEAG